MFASHADKCLWFAVLGSAAQRHWALLHPTRNPQDMARAASGRDVSTGRQAWQAFHLGCLIVQASLWSDGDDSLVLRTSILIDKSQLVVLAAQSKACDEASKHDGAVLYFQGDAEKAIDAPISFLMDRSKPG